MNRVWIGLIICIALLPWGTVYAENASLYLLPESDTHAVDDVFDVQVLANSGGTPINAAEADLRFNTSVLQVQKISIDGTILNSWPTPAAFSNTDGTVDFSGLTSGKFASSSGLLITVTFKAIRNMPTEIHFASGALLAADGVESNVISSMRSAFFLIQPKVVAISAQSINSNLTYAGSSTEAVGAGSTSEDIPSPVFVDYQGVVSVGNRILVKGTAPANATISLWIQHGDDRPRRTDFSANNDGTFTFTSDTEAQEGVYHVWAFTQGEGGLTSVSSEKIVITAGSTGVAAAAQFETALISDVAPFFALLILAGLLLGYIGNRYYARSKRI
jgi:hypothetical protein